jgi:hypothetical protein
LDTLAKEAGAEEEAVAMRSTKTEWLGHRPA